MQKHDKLRLHEETCDMIHNLYEAKNHDYGDSVKDTFDKFGMDAFLVRMYDKLNRIYTLTRPDKMNDIRITDEKIEDTLLDLANYAIIAYVEAKVYQIDTLVQTKEAANTREY